MKSLLNYIFVFAVTSIWASQYWLNGMPISASMVTSPTFYKPYVYRQLVPVIARCLVSVGMRIDLAVILVVALCGVGLCIVWDKIVGGKFLWVFALYTTGLMLFGESRATYDLMTAFLWSLAFLFLLKHNKVGMAILFSVMCLNRVDTALFIIPVWWWIYRKDYLLVGYQGVIYLLFRVGLYWLFRDNVGVVALVEPLQNIQKFLSNPVMLIAHISVITVYVILILQNHKKSDILSKSLIILAPIFFGLYLVFGQAGEPRVLWEVYVPAVSLILL